MTDTGARREIDELCDQIIAAHTDLHHPGRRCRENQAGKCLDAFGGREDEHAARLDACWAGLEAGVRAYIRGGVGR
jgi:hypothetical protein